jgi:hypothetical protein
VITKSVARRRELDEPSHVEERGEVGDGVAVDLELAEVFEAFEG